MTITVQRWGNSLALRIPSALAKVVHLRQGTVVEISVVEGQMVLKPKGGSKLSLSQMLRGITKGNRHTEQDWGAASAVLVSQEELETLEVLADKKLMRSLSRAEKDERAGRLVCLESANRPLRRPRKGTAAPLSARANSRRPK